jgi:hypothetical protein
MLSCLYLTRARSNPTPEPRPPDPRTPGPPPVARVRVCSDVRTSALATLGGARGSLKKSSARATPKNLFVGEPASRRPTLRPPPFLKRAHFLSSRCRVCLRRYGLYFMSSRRSEVLRRFCGRASDERGGFGGRRQFRVFFSFSSPNRGVVVVVVVVAFERVVVVVSRLASGRLTRGGVAFSRASSATASRPARERSRCRVASRSSPRRTKRLVEKPKPCR